jgi:hypothetical protein
MRVIALLVLAGACASPSGNSGFADGGGTDTPPGPGSDGGFVTKDSGVPTAIAEVFGHSATTLYRVDPNTKAVNVVADFKGCTGSVTDIALNESGAMFATSKDKLYAVDRKTATCTFISNGAYPNSLSFVPRGTLDANAEVLVGFEGADYIRIDTVKDGPTFLTVKADTGATRCKTEDCLVELDPKTGQISTDFGEIGYSQVFGMSFWDGAIYGFTNTGTLIEVRANGTNLVTKKLTIPGAPSDLSFFGAGSTTSAPVGPR